MRDRELLEKIRVFTKERGCLDCGLIYHRIENHFKDTAPKCICKSNREEIECRLDRIDCKVDGVDCNLSFRDTVDEVMGKVLNEAMDADGGEKCQTENH